MRSERLLVVSICIAYEQGYGKGLHNTRDIDNPYVLEIHPQNEKVNKEVK